MDLDEISGRLDKLHSFAGEDGNVYASDAKDIIDELAVLVSGMDTNGTILYATRAAERMFGFGVEGGMVGISIDTLLPQRLQRVHHDERQKYYQDAMPRPMGVMRKLVGCRRNGTEFDAVVYLWPKQRADGKRVVRALVFDMTDLSNP